MLVTPSPKPSRSARDPSTNGTGECMAPMHAGYGTIPKRELRPHKPRRQSRQGARCQPPASEFRATVSLQSSEKTLLMVEAADATIPMRRLHPRTFAGQTVTTFGQGDG